jgi:hypothetical protein
MTTRRSLFSQALGLIPIVRDRLDEPDEEDDRPSGERPYRTYREGVADLQRRERAAAERPPPAPGQLPQPPTPRTWREGAKEVEERERRA